MRPQALLALLLVPLAACRGAVERAEASPAPPATRSTPTAPPVPNIDTAPVFESLPPPTLEGPPRYTFREAVKALPRAGQKALPFPPAQQGEVPPRVASGPLTVSRHQPEGEQGLSNVVSATFNQPMVPLTDLAQLEKLPVPLQLEPLPPGRFRWLGTSTVEFEAQDRLPFATTYRATLPAGTRSASGSVLGKAVSWTFSTPRPKVESFEPQGSDVEPRAQLHLAFNQAVSPTVVAEQLQCKVGGRRYALALDKPAEDPFAHDASSDVAVKRRIFEERNVFLRPVEPLPLASEVRCTLPRGFKGAEGPDATREDQTFAFHTYEPLVLRELRCGWSDRCAPGGPLSLVFNNALSEDQDFAARVRVEPKVADLEVQNQGSYLLLQGSFAASTKYSVTVLAPLEDVHHQKLGKDQTRTQQIGPADPMLALGAGENAVVERVGPRTLPLSYASLTRARLRYFHVAPSGLAEAVRAVQRWVRPEQDPFDGRSAFIDRELPLGARSDAPGAGALSLDEPLGNGASGLFIVDVSSEELRKFDPYSSIHRSAVVQVTDLALTAHLTDENAVVLVTSLSSGKPVGGAQVALQDSKGATLSEGLTDPHGVALLAGPVRGRGGPLVLVAHHDSDVAALLCDNALTGQWLSSYNGTGSNSHAATVVASLFTDRSPYRPGDTVHLAGVVRMMTHGRSGTVEPIPAGSRFRYTLTDPRGQRVAKGEGQLGPRGLIAIDLPIAGDGALGGYSFQGTLLDAGPLRDQGFGASFDVEEFRTPEYKVAVDVGEPLHFVNDTVSGKVVGEYFFGGPMAGANASWRISRSRGYFVPPHAPPGYSFGSEGPIEPMYEFGERFGRRRPSADAQVASGTGALDSQGRLAFSAKLEPGSIEGPVSFSIEASVTDPSLQQIHANATVLAHAARVYPGVKLDRTVVKEGESVGLQVVALDVDGKPVDPRGASVELVLESWTRAKSASGGYTYERKQESAGHCALAPPKSAGEPATCRLTVSKAGDYLVRVKLADERGRANTSTARVYAFGAHTSPWFRPDRQLSVELVPDQPSYAPGATAHVLVKSPFPHSVGIVGIDREGLVEYRPIEFDGATSTIDLPVSAREVPNVHLMIALTRGRISPEAAGAAPGDPDDLGRPMYAGGQLSLAISTAEHQLQVAVSPSKPAIEPGGTADVRIQTRDSRGTPASASVIVAIVDEGILSLEGYALPDPLGAIFQDRGPEAGNVATLPRVVARETRLKKLSMGAKRGVQSFKSAGPGAPPPMEPAASAPMDAMAERAVGGALAAQPPAPKLAARALFKSTAFFSAREQTDAQGNLELHVKMPENLTSYRIMVVAVGEGDRYGRGDGTVQLRKPLLVRPALPRFLNFGDHFQAAAVLNNQTDRDLWVDAQARAANGEVAAQRQRVLVRAGQATQVEFAAQAGAPGLSRWQFAAVALDPERHSDAAELNLPIELPATSEAFATYGVADQSVLQPLQLPKDALPDFGALEVSLSSTALTSLADAVMYLHDYPYECVEQTASRILPFIALKQVVLDFHVAGAGTAEARDTLVHEGLASILRKQRSDGGFGYWSDSRESYLYVSSWAAYVLQRAKASGYAVDENALHRLTAFLRARLENPRHDLGEDEDYASQAMAALVLGDLGSPQPELVKRIYGHRQSLPLYGKAWLMDAANRALVGGAEVAELNRELQNAVVEKAGSAHFAERASESIRLLMHSNDRTDAIVLASLIHVRPKDALIAKIVRGLNDSRRAGRWDTTQSNAWATLALGDYYAAFEKAVPHFSAELFVGQQLAANARFDGRSTATLEEKIPLSAIAKLRDTDLTLAKNGAGRLYYRLGLRYAPKSLQLAAAEQGFTITRSYLPMDDAPGTVTTEADGTVRIKAGSEVKVKLQVVVTDRSQFIAVDDPLPAGLEAVNTSFLTNQSTRLSRAEDDQAERTGWWWWWVNPFSHQELKDDRVLLFADQLPAGVYTHSYVARATTRGTFQVPPARALEMYAPENFGRTASTVVRVE